ncbi:hypothetical protein HMN09_00133200 [Mycena chlorophos]|uniref:DUF6699 domain-containing protein n=1 Tax=Mycena chlorophos TaxID=658473 RepID=A0A8H6TPK6_MYCCL|nr:hypothetical protein HMN09_00133200 [Mycena chlorophos]
MGWLSFGNSNGRKKQPRPPNPNPMMSTSYAASDPYSYNTYHQSQHSRSPMMSPNTATRLQQAPRMPNVSLPVTTPSPAGHRQPSFGAAAAQWYQSPQTHSRGAYTQQQHQGIRAPVPSKPTGASTAARLQASVASPVAQPAPLTHTQSSRGRRSSVTPGPPPAPAQYPQQRSTSHGRTLPAHIPMRPPPQQGYQPQPQQAFPHQQSYGSSYSTSAHGHGHVRHDSGYESDATRPGTSHSRRSSRSYTQAKPLPPRPGSSRSQNASSSSSGPSPVAPPLGHDPMAHTDGPRSILKTSANRGQRLPGGSSSRRGSSASTRSVSAGPPERLATVISSERKPLAEESIILAWPLAQSYGRPGKPGSCQPCIRYDIGRSPRMSFAVLDLRPSADGRSRFAALSDVDLRQPASTHCVLTQMRIQARFVEGGWIVIKRAGPVGIRVLDVLEGIWQAYSYALPDPGSVPPEVLAKGWGALIQALDLRATAAPDGVRQGEGEAYECSQQEDEADMRPFVDCRDSLSIDWNSLRRHWLGETTAVTQTATDVALARSLLSYTVWSTPQYAPVVLGKQVAAVQSFSLEGSAYGNVRDVLHLLHNHTLRRASLFATHPVPALQHPLRHQTPSSGSFLYLPHLRGRGPAASHAGFGPGDAPASTLLHHNPCLLETALDDDDVHSPARCPRVGHRRSSLAKPVPTGSASGRRRLRRNIFTIAVLLSKSIARADTQA